jgi:hypothetical protein
MQMFASRSANTLGMPIRCRPTCRVSPRVALIRMQRATRINAEADESRDANEAATSSPETRSPLQSEVYQAAIIERLIPKPDPSLTSVSLAGYAVVHVLNLLSGLGLLSLISTAPHLLQLEEGLLDSFSTIGASCMMLGMVACSFLRSSAVLHFLVRSVANLELMTWRHQRLSLSLGISAAITAVASVLLLIQGPSTPILAASLLATSAPTAVICLWTSFQALRTAENFCWSVDFTRPIYTLQKLTSCFLHGISSLPGLISIIAMAVSCAGVSCGLVPSGLGVPLSQYELLRVSASSSMILSVFFFHELLEFTPWAPERDAPAFASQAILTNINRGTGELSRVYNSLNPPPDRYLWLNAITLFTSLAQTVILSKAHAWNAIPVLNHDPIWGCLFYSTGLMLAYSTCLAGYLNYNSIVGLGGWLAYQAASLIASLFDNIIYKWKWQAKIR